MITVIVFVGFYLMVALAFLDRFKSQGERWGEQSKLWKWLAYPANVNGIYLAYIICFVTGIPAEFVKFYAVYFCVIALGQSVHLVRKTLP